MPWINITHLKYIFIKGQWYDQCVYSVQLVVLFMLQSSTCCGTPFKCKSKFNVIFLNDAMLIRFLFICVTNYIEMSDQYFSTIRITSKIRTKFNKSRERVCFTQDSVWCTFLSVEELCHICAYLQPGVPPLSASTWLSSTSYYHCLLYNFS